MRLKINTTIEEIFLSPVALYFDCKYVVIHFNACIHLFIVINDSDVTNQKTYVSMNNSVLCDGLY